MGLSIADTAALVEARYGSSAAHAFKWAALSYVERSMYSLYHWETADRLEGVGRDESSEAQRFAWLIGFDEEHSYVATEFKFGAHATAAVQDLHALADLCAHAALYATGLANTAVGSSLRGGGAADVAKELSGHGCSLVSGLLTKLISLSDFRHVGALCNMAKHRSIVRPKYKFNEDGHPCNRFYFHEFEYKGHTYPEMEVLPFLRQARDVQTAICSEIFASVAAH